MFLLSRQKRLFATSFKTHRPKNRPAGNMGFCASRARSSNFGCLHRCTLVRAGRNSVELLVVNLYFYFLIGLQFRAGQSTMPCLHKALYVVVNFFFATEQILICSLFVSIGIWVGQTFPEFFLFQKSKKKSAYNMGFGAIRADGSCVSTFVFQFSFGSGWTNIFGL